MSLADYQVANDQDFLLRGLRHAGRWRKEIRIGTVVHHGTADVDVLRHSISQNTLHPAADTDYGARRTIDIDRNFTPPSRGHAVEKATVKHVQTMKRKDKWNPETARQ